MGKAMNSVTIKHLDPDDLDILLHSGNDVFDNPVIPEQARAFLASDMHHIVVALDGKKLVGMASAVTLLHPDKQPQVFISEVGVQDDYLRRGIGRRLIKRLIQVVRGDDEPDIWLATEEDNVAARALYSALGARETKGIVVCDWGGAMDADQPN